MLTHYKVRTGFHCDGKGNVFRKGQVFHSKRRLHEEFPNKFDIVKTEEITDEELAKSKEKKKIRYNRVEALQDLGKDVTQKFPDAINQGLRVWQTEDGEFNVSDERDLYTPLNKKPMTRSGTKKFLLNR